MKIIICVFILTFLLVGHKSFAQEKLLKLRAFALLDSKRYDEAIVLLKDSCSINESSTLILLSKSYLNLKKYELALPLLLKLETQHFVFYNYEIAYCYAHLENEELSLVYFKKAIAEAAKPSYSEISNLNSIVKSNLNQYISDSLIFLNKAKEALITKDEFEMTEILESKTSSKTWPSIYFYKALIEVQTGNIKKAKQDMKIALNKDANLKKDASYKEFCFTIGDSVQYYNFVINEKSDYNIDLLLDQIEANLFFKKEDLSIELIEQIKNICIEFEPYSKRLIAIYKKNNLSFEVLKLLNKLIAVNKFNTFLLNQRGLIYLDAKMFKEAKHDFSMSLDILPTQSEIFYLRAKARLALSETEGAESDLNIAKDLGAF